jgi:hypothetical protein
MIDAKAGAVRCGDKAARKHVENLGRHRNPAEKVLLRFA